MHHLWLNVMTSNVMQQEYIARIVLPVRRMVTENNVWCMKNNVSVSINICLSQDPM